MGGNLFKTIIAILMLALLAFLAGSLAADGAKQALVPVGLIIGLFVLLYLGKNCWWLVYAASVLTPLLGISVCRGLPIGYSLSVVLLLYWCAMYVLKRVKITWHSLWLLDIMTGVLLLYFLITWIRHPVYIDILVDELLVDGDVKVGGRPYVWAVLSMALYVFISIVPIKVEVFFKVLKVISIVAVVLAFLKIGKVLFTSGMGGGIDGTDVLSDRISDFAYYSRLIYMFLISKYSIWGCCISPWKFFLIGFSVLGMAVSGGRTVIMDAAVSLIMLQCVRRKLFVFILFAVFAYGALVYATSERLMEGLPYGVKRVLSPLPGIEFEDNYAVEDAKYSIEWRVEMWRWALTPSMGYINDYIWGDGFGLGAAMLRERDVRRSRGYDVLTQKDFAVMGGWHSGPITAIQTIGCVGLGILLIWSIIVMYYSIRLAFSIRGLKNHEYVYFYSIPIIAMLFQFYVSAGTFDLIFSYFINILIVKIAYVLVRERGLIQPLFARKLYVPLMHREADEAGAATQKAALPLHS